MRGFAAWAVVFSHLVLTFHPQIWSLQVADGVSLTWVEQCLFYTPLRVVFDGRFAVSLFFVHSGFVLSYSFFLARQPLVVSSAAIRRYFRLGLPIFAAVLLVQLGFSCLDPKALPNLMSTSYMFTPSWWLALNHGAWQEILYFNNDETYIPVLWTIGVELKGSLLVFAVLSLVGNLRNRWVVYVVLIAYFSVDHLAGFMVGLVMADIYTTAPWDKIRRRAGWWAGLPGALLLVSFGCYLGTFRSPEFPLEGWLAIIPIKFARMSRFVAAMFVISGLLVPSGLRRLMSTRPLVFNGKLCYAVYLLHWPLICAVSAFIFKVATVDFRWDYSLAAWSASIVLVLSLGLLSCPFYWYVDKPAIRLGKFIYQRFFALRSSIPG